MTDRRLQEAEMMLRSGASDERVEQIANVSLSEIIALRVKLSSSPPSRLRETEHRVVNWMRS